MNEKSKLYNQLCKVVKDCYSDKNSQSWLKKTLELWKTTKTGTNYNIADIKRRASVMIKNLNSESFKKKGSLLRFYAKVAEKPSQ